MATPDTIRLFDVRTVHRHIREGRVTEEAYRAYLAELPDVSDKVRPPEEIPLPSTEAEAAAVATDTAPEVPAASTPGATTPPVATAPSSPATDFAAGWDLPDEVPAPAPAAPQDPESKHD
ncbi:MAG: hypothetical protein D6705_03070 [Deltaproteobacteria bacterium]|nr:MAG: hypothetical protein D6705_03070 [Deltaproteobacteria bacterium]